MRILLIIILGCTLTWVIAAQTGASIGGVVSVEGVPQADASVTLTATSNPQVRFEQRTDENGTFRFPGVPAGTYILAAKKRLADGRTVETTGETVKLSDDESVLKDLELVGSSPSAIREEVTVRISAGTSQPISAISKTVNVIEGQEMRDRADFALTETLKTIPGFRVQQLGGFGRTASIKTRGLRNQDTAMLIDGIRFRDASSIFGDASPFLSDLTLTSVSRIEVLRGSGSSLYGTNAIGGTIDLQTPVPKPGFHGQLSAAFGGLGLQRYRGNISDGTEDGKFGFNLAVARTLYTKGIDGEDDAHNTNFQSRLEFNPWANTNISGRFFVSDAYVRLNTDPDIVGAEPPSNFGIIDAHSGVNFVPDANDPDNFQRSQFFNGQVVLTHVVNDKLIINAHYSGLRTSRKNENGPLGVGFQSPSGSVFDGTIHTAAANATWTPNVSNLIKAGYEFESEGFGNTGWTPDGSGNFFTRAGQSSSTVYVQDIMRLLGGDLQIAGGVRAQFFHLGSPEFSLTNAPYSNLRLSDPPTALTFDGAVSYFFDATGTKLRAHAGNGYRVPSLFERFGSFYNTFGIEPQFVALGDPGLKPERSIAFDAGIEQGLFDGKVNLTAVYFYTVLEETIGFSNVVSPIGDTQRPFGGYINSKGGIARGAELSAVIRPTDSTYVFASYTFTNSDQREPQVTGSGVTSSLGIPRDQFTFVATQNFKRLWVSVDLVSSSSYLAPVFSNSSFNMYVYRFRGNRKMDLTAGYTFPLDGERTSVRLFGTIENVLGYEYFENGFRTPQRNARIGLSFGF